jgi:predicted nucleic acid-binding protein
VIFLDTNVLYSVFVKTEFSPVARNIITGPCDLASSLTVLSELVFISVRRICKNKYGTRNYRDYNRIIAEKGYEPFKEEINLIFQLFDERDISIVPVNENIEDWRNIMAKYRLRALMTFSALTGLNLNDLHPNEAAHFASLPHFQTEQNGLLDPAH